MFKEFFKLWNSTDLLTQAVNDSHEMLKISQDMFNLIDVKYSDLKKEELSELGEKVKKKDYLLNHYDKSIRKKIYEHLTLSEKDDQELYTSLALFSIVGDIERIGDYIKNMHEVKSAAEMNDEQLNLFINTMFKNMHALFIKTVKAYKGSEEQTAKEINNEFFKYKNEINDKIDILIVNNDYKNSAGYALFLRYLKRVGAHLMHISSSISNPIDKIGYYLE